MINTNEITNKKFGIFMTVAFLAAYVPLTIAGLAYKGGNTLLCLFLFRFIAIFIPLIAVAVSGLPFKKLGWKPKFSFKYLIASLIGPQILSWTGAAIFFLFNKDAFGVSMDSYLAMMPSELAGMIDTSETAAYAYLIVMAVMSLTFLPISQILPSLGEEAGWRGVMYPYLKNTLGPIPGKLIGGALWGAIPGIFKAFFNVNEVISAIMFNWIGLYSVNMIIANMPRMVGTAWDESVANRTGKLSKANPGAILPKLGLDKLMGSDYVNAGILIAIIFAVIIWVILNKTTFGYELKACGYNRNASQYAGINAKKNIILAMTISGALAGLGGAISYLAGSIQYTLEEALLSMGFNGIPVALLGVSHPLATIFSALFIGYLKVGGDAMQPEFTTEIIDIIIAAIIYMSAFSLLMQEGIRKLLSKKRRDSDANVREVKKA